jgi:thioredoxin-related protein
MLVSSLTASLAAGWGPALRHAHAQPDQRALPQPDSLATLVRRADRERKPIVALFSQKGCPYCEAIRREQLVHLAREQDQRGVIVAEFDIADRRTFAASERGSPPAAESARSAASAKTAWLAAGSPEALARAFDVRLAPTVVFLGPRGELAERLIGYTSRDFYGAYLDDRIEAARAAISAR